MSSGTDHSKVVSISNIIEQCKKDSLYYLDAIADPGFRIKAAIQWSQMPTWQKYSLLAPPLTWVVAGIRLCNLYLALIGGFSVAAGISAILMFENLAEQYSKMTSIIRRAFFDPQQYVYDKFIQNISSLPCNVTDLEIGWSDINWVAFLNKHRDIPLAQESKYDLAILFKTILPQHVKTVTIKNPIFNNEFDKVIDVDILLEHNRIGKKMQNQFFKNDNAKVNFKFEEPEVQGSFCKSLTSMFW